MRLCAFLKTDAAEYQDAVEHVHGAERPSTIRLARMKVPEARGYEEEFCRYFVFIDEDEASEIRPHLAVV